ncbi:MAG TPA: ZIP family metal transporter, partial [Pseudoneobacillus sp.]|nr:ZIP family metal transporter [Pseudoneobacillus sp.]
MKEVLIGSILSALSTGFGAMIILFMSRNVTHR